MTVLKYSAIHKYIVKAECDAPLHIGSAVGDKGEILIHPVDDMPFIQSSSLTGVLRAMSLRINGSALTDTLFGAGRMQAGRNSINGSSRVRVSDGLFDLTTVKKELRPRVKIDGRTGTVHTAVKSGNNVKAGQKFNTEFIGAGARFSFELYLYEDPDAALKLDTAIEKVFSAIKQEALQIGGQKSNGGGFVKLEKLLKKSFDMTNPTDREEWADEDTLKESAYSDISCELSDVTGLTRAYSFLVEGKTKASLQVKGIAVDKFGECVPDSCNMKNARLQYIIPGSSLKGSLRSRMEYIASTLNRDSLIETAFGHVGSGSVSGSAGCVIVKDTVVDCPREVVQHRIRLDKFTAGVMNGGLFEESNIGGNLKLQILVRESNKMDATAGLLIFALRDLAAGLMNVGSGYNVGKGFLDIDRITITYGDKKGILDISDNRIIDDDGIIKQCMKALEAIDREVK